MANEFLALVCVVIALAAGLAAIVLPLIVLNRTQQMGELIQRVAKLEREVHRLRVGEDSAAPMILEAPAQAKTVVNSATVSEAGIPTVLPARGPRRTTTTFNLEAWIGGRALGWVAVVLLVFAVGFFLRHIFENNLIGPIGKVAIILVLGLGLCLGGLRFHRRGWNIFGQFLTSAGVVLLYLSTYGSFGYYTLLPRDHAAVFLVTIIVEAAALAIVYEAPAIAIMAVIGGLLTPVLLRTEYDQFLNLFTYLVLLNAGVVVLSLLCAWPAVNTIALLGTQLLFWIWYVEHYHPEKRPAALAFQATLFGLFLTHTIACQVWRHRRANLEDLARLALNGFLFTVALFVLLAPDHADWRGTLGMALALVYTLLALLVGTSKVGDPRLLFAAVAMSAALMATAFAWQANAAWIALCWAAQGSVLWWFGLRIRADALRALGGTLLALAALRLLFDVPGAHPAPFVPIFNKFGLPATAVALEIIVAAAASRRFLRGGAEVDLLAMRALSLAGVALLWLVLSFEAFAYFEAQSFQPWYWDSRLPIGRASGSDPERLRVEMLHLRRAAQTTLSVLWAAYAMAVLAMGFRLGSRPLRWFALALFGLTLVKVVLVDTENLPGMYRVAVFLALSVMMALAAWGYQKVRNVLLAPAPTETSHEIT